MFQEPRPHKSLGQHYLIDQRIIWRIIQSAQLSPQDMVIEIGPGTGQLTRHLVRQAGKLVALEIDPRLCQHLQQTLAEFPNLEIIQADALSFDYESLFAKYSAPPDGKFKLIANLPYYVATPILQRLTQFKRHFEYLLVMLQQEVAARITAQPGTKSYGVLSLGMQYHFKTKPMFTVPRQAFRPIPEVESAVVKLTPWPSPPVDVPDEKLFFDIIKAAFSHRRKTLYNSMRQATWLNLSPGVLEQAMQSADLPSKVRGESLSLQDFARLARILNK